jgi:hypothetical protein
MKIKEVAHILMSNSNYSVEVTTVDGRVFWEVRDYRETLPFLVDSGNCPLAEWRRLLRLCIDLLD